MNSERKQVTSCFLSLNMENSINTMVNRIATILSENNPNIYLFGSVALNDFKLGWSDIDIICLTEKVLSEEQAQVLVELRQTLLKEYPDNVYYRLFEGGILSINAFLNKSTDRVVYWGTSGQRITDTYELDPFSKIEIKDSESFYLEGILEIKSHIQLKMKLKKQLIIIMKSLENTQKKLVKVLLQQGGYLT